MIGKHLRLPAAELPGSSQPVARAVFFVFFFAQSDSKMHEDRVVKGQGTVTCQAPSHCMHAQ